MKVGRAKRQYPIKESLQNKEGKRFSRLANAVCPPKRIMYSWNFSRLAKDAHVNDSVPVNFSSERIFFLFYAQEQFLSI